MADLTNILGGPWRPPTPNLDPPEIQAQDAMADAGLTPPERIIIDGEIHRFRPGTKGKPGEDKAGWYVLFPGTPVAGRFGDWRSSISLAFCADIGRDLTPAEQMARTRHLAEAQKKAEAARLARQAQAAETVAEIWDNAGFAHADHPYLARKGIQPHSVRITGDGRLIVPMHADGELASLQYIGHDGVKRYHPGGKASGAYWRIGASDEPGPVYLAEGFATAATIHEVTQRPCWVAFSAQNLPAVAEVIRQTEHELVIVADNDASGVGLSHANQAAAKHGARVVMPPEAGMDANDYHLAGNDLAALLQPPVSDWLIPADELSGQPAPIRWLIKRWLQQQSMMMMHGPSGGGKSFVLIDMLMHIAAGLPEWRGHKVTPGAVAYLAGEGHHGLRSRIAAWKQHHGVGKLEMWVSASGCNLNKPEGLQKALQALRALPKRPLLMAIDTLHRFLDGDENSAQDAKEMLDACSVIAAEFECAVILVHHTGVSDEAQHRARGSSAWKGALDIEINIRPGGRDGPLQIRQMKVKDAEEAEPLWAELESVTIDGWLDEDGEPVTSAVPVPADEPQKGRKPTEIEDHIKTMERAWFDSGAEDLDGKPYITRSALWSQLEKMGFSESTIKTYIKPSGGRLIAKLTAHDYITPAREGWVISNPGTAAAWLILRKK